MSSGIAELPKQIAVVGLGYVGLPLATAFAQHLPTLGLDVNPKRIKELQQGYDRNRDIPTEILRSSGVRFTNDFKTLRDTDFIIVVVPTPLDWAKRPDLGPLIKASELVGRNLCRRSIVVYESTVYPGCTEEVCLPILERESGLQASRDFKIGYSPERINPGDREHSLEKVVKVVAGQDKETTELIARVYGLVIKAGVYQASDIKTAEAAKVVENTQRDLNIALMNELALLFHKLGLDTHEVLKAARTKWNFLPFEPGLVGGHCIPEDPCWLAHKAQQVGFHPELILAGRRVNDAMSVHVARETIRLFSQSGQVVKESRILVLGFAFKENVPDVRNTRVLDLVRELETHGCLVQVYDPLVSVEDLEQLGIHFLCQDPWQEVKQYYEAVVLAVPHRMFREKRLQDYLSLLPSDAPRVFVDIRGVYSTEVVRAPLTPPLLYWKI